MRGRTTWIIVPGAASEAGCGALVGQVSAGSSRVLALADRQAPAVKLADGREVPTRSIYEFITPLIGRQLVQASVRLARSWRETEPIAQALKWDGVQWGEMLDRSLPTEILIEPIRLVEAVQLWAAQVPPSEVILCDGRSKLATAVALVAQKLGVPVVAQRASLSLGEQGGLDRLKHGAFLWLMDVRDVALRFFWPWILHRWSRGSLAAGRGHGSSIVAVGFMRNHFSHLLPALRILQHRGRRVRILQGLVGKALGPDVRSFAEGLDAGSVDGYADRDTWKQYRAARRHFRLAWRRLRDEGGFRKRFCHNGIDLWPLLESSMRHIVTIQLANCVRYAALTHRVIQQEKPAVLLFGDDGGSKACAMVHSARVRGVPTILVQHGMPANPWDYVPRADWMAVFGEQTREVLSEWGASTRQLIPTGASGFDSLLQLRGNPEEMARKADQVRAKAHLPCQARPILIVPSPSAFTDLERFLSVCLSVAGQLQPAPTVVVKLKPGESYALVEKIARKVGVSPFITKEDLWGWLSASAVVIGSPNGTVGIEALLLGKPVITCRTCELNSIFEGCGECVRETATSEELQSVLKKVLAEPPSVDLTRLEFLLGPLDGQAAMRLADTIESIGARPE